MSRETSINISSYSSGDKHYSHIILINTGYAIISPAKQTGQIVGLIFKKIVRFGPFCILLLLHISVAVTFIEKLEYIKFHTKKQGLV